MGNAFTKKSDEAGGSAAAETFDGGGFVPLGVYPNQPQDYDRKVVRKLIIERKLSPFYKGLADVDDLPPGAIDGEFAADAFAGAAADTAAANGGNKGEPAKQSPSSGAGAADGSPSAGGGGGGAGSTSRSATSTSSAAPHLKRTSFHSRFAVSGLAAGSSSPSSVVGAPLRRSNSCSNTAAPHAAASPVQISPRELYDRPVECPICFLYYPPNINYSRCCDQPLCTECFLQMKRSEVTNTPVECPFCCVTDFGIIYEPPEFIRSHQQSSQQLGSADPLTRSASSLPATGKNPNPLRSRRKKGLSTNDPSVVTCDDIRPDFMRRFVEARYRANAAARQLVSDGAGSGRRTLIRQSPPPNARRSSGSNYAGYLRGMGAELEELMVMEAVRLSLLDEEQRQAQALRQSEAEATAMAWSSQDVDARGSSGAVDTVSDSTAAATVNTEDNCYEATATATEPADGGRRQSGVPAAWSELALRAGSPLDDDDAPLLPVLGTHGATGLPSATGVSQSAPGSSSATGAAADSSGAPAGGNVESPVGSTASVPAQHSKGRIRGETDERA